MFVKKTFVVIATTLAIAGGSLTANAAPLAGSAAGLEKTVKSRTVEAGHRGGGRHGHGHRGHRPHYGHHRGYRGHGGYYRPGYVGFYPAPCRIERVKVYNPYVGYRVWVNQRVCY